MISDIALIESRRVYKEGDTVAHISRGIGKFASYVDGHIGIGMVAFYGRKNPIACWLVDLSPSREETNFDKLERFFVE